MPATTSRPDMRLKHFCEPLTTFGETSYSPPAVTFTSLAKSFGAAEALKGEKYKPAIFNVKWG